MNTTSLGLERPQRCVELGVVSEAELAPELLHRLWRHLKYGGTEWVRGLVAAAEGGEGAEAAGEGGCCSSRGWGRGVKRGLMGRLGIGD